MRGPITDCALQILYVAGYFHEIIDTGGVEQTITRATRLFMSTKDGKRVCVKSRSTASDAFTFSGDDGGLLSKILTVRPKSFWIDGLAETQSDDLALIGANENPC